MVPMDAEGRFISPGLPPGLYRIEFSGFLGWSRRVVSAGRDMDADQPLDLGTDDLTDIVVRMSATTSLTSISGKVLAPDGKPREGSRVILFPQDPNIRMWGGSTRTQVSRIDRAGTFRIQNVPPGEYLITAVKDEMPELWRASAYLDSLAPRAMRVRVELGAPTIVELK